MGEFTCLSLSPVHLEHPGLAIATSRAGGVGILDREFCPDAKLDVALQNLDSALNLLSPDQLIGLRLRELQIESSHALLQRLSSRPHWLILCHWQTETLATLIDALPQVDERRLCLEITDIEQLSTIGVISDKIDGLVARGHECGGWGGNDPAFILSQKIIQAGCPFPIYVQGGIGLHTAAACRGAGAAGIVLDDQLWLMPESPLPTDWSSYLHNLNGQEAIPIGERLGDSVRVLSRPGFKAIAQLQNAAGDIELSSTEAIEATWEETVASLVGWGEPGTAAWPMGQAIGLAAAAREQFQTTGRYIQAILKASEDHLITARRLRPLGPGAPLAVSHGTRYPISQGPMTRVSDTAEFADAVSRAGGLPWVALALMRGEQVQTLLAKTQQLVGERPWGVGILGFVPQALREAQLKAVLAVKPPFALIAGGRPDQAKTLEQEGIATYLHVPTPSLLKMFLKQGARRFIFEGRECGGHVGPLSSFVLWESMITMLLEEVSPTVAPEVHVFFAGGIHDARSASMVNAMAAPLAERGIKIGVLMGTAYLFTQEAVACGAIMPEFQRQALACTRTINLETGPGHASRCALTPFAEEFYATRRRMMQEGRSAEDIKNTLEDLTLGRLRIASKGLVRQGSEIHPVEANQQLSTGMYMIGQVATLRNQVITVEELHQEVSGYSTELLQNLSPQKSESPQAVNPSRGSDIAIVGIGTLLPKADAPIVFWENILQKVNGISEIPRERWDWRLYYDPNQRTPDKVYSKWGGFLDDVPFDPIRFGIPPKSIKSIEPAQLLALEAVRRALIDAGYENGNFDRENTSVVIGSSGGSSDLGQQYATRAELPRMVENPDDRVWDRLPEWTEESFPGILPNVAAGRIANRFDFGGSNFVVDAACASSLTALTIAVNDLESGRCNMAVAGGLDTVQSAFSFFCFSKTQALSPKGVARAFDQSADGIVISEGLAMVVLKRLVDAERDGDRIYAVIKATASSSDGKGLSMTAPASVGQQRALARAYAKAGFSPNTLGLYEAHGTGTVAGDRAELETITGVLKSHQAEPKSCVLGSVKTMIGHTKATAGVVAMVKAALALHYKTLPPHANVENPLETLKAEDSPLYLLQEAQPWLQPKDHPRRAGVSAFGFGGTNFHLVMEEYGGNVGPSVVGAEAWPYELLVWRDSSREGLIQDIQDLHQQLSQGAQPRLRDLAFTCAKRLRQSSPIGVGLSLVVTSLEQLASSLSIALKHLRNPALEDPLPPHIQLATVTEKPAGKVAFLFPGQVAQYPDMAREVALYFSEMREALEFANGQIHGVFPKRLSQYIYPPSPYSAAEAERVEAELTNTHVVQPALGAVELGYLALARRVGLVPDMVGGHSYGEYAALHAAGVLSRESFIRLSETRGRVMLKACQYHDGAMAAINASREVVTQRLAGLPDICASNFNAPEQVVISGSRVQVEALVNQLQAEQIMARVLPVSGAFHSPFVEGAQADLTAAIAATSMAEPQVAVYSNMTGKPYPADVEGIRQNLTRHLLSTVEFVEQIQSMYEDGARLFVEIGPKRILTRFAHQILGEHPHLAVSLDGQGRDLQGFLNSLGYLAIHGVEVNLESLFQKRSVKQLSISRLMQQTCPPDLASTTWYVNGGHARPKDEPLGYTGKVPALTQETKALAQASHRGSPNGNGHGDGAKSLVTVSTAAVVNNHPPSAASGSLDLKSSSLQSSLPMSYSPAQTNPPASNGEKTSFALGPMGQPIPGEVALAAYQAYQETMRQFLTLQEQVMGQFLNADLSGRSLNSGMPQGAGSAGVSSRTALPQSQAAAAIATMAEAAAIPTMVSRPVTREGVPTASTSGGGPSPGTEPAVSPGPAELKPAPALSRETLSQQLLSLVSDRTGYPQEMLGMDMDMEADLGIDSIKRVEIFVELQNVLPDALASKVQDDMEHFTQVKTLNGLVDALFEVQVDPASTAANGKADPSQPPAAVSLTSSSGLSPQANPGDWAEPAQQPQGEPISLDRQSLTQTLLNLVSDRTGYPQEMLGMDMDMEADLGIDSIKRVEIFVELQNVLPAALARVVQDQMEHFTQVKTLSGLIDALLDVQSPGPEPVSPGTVTENNSLGQQETNSLGKSLSTVAATRYVVQPCAKPITEPLAKTLTGLFLITADEHHGQGVADRVAQGIREIGGSASVLSWDQLASAENLKRTVAQLREHHGPICGIMHLAGLSKTALPEDWETWKATTTRQSKSLFYLLQFCSDDLCQVSGQVIAASALGGQFGRNGQCGPGLPTSGGSNGLLKTMMIEWPGVRAKAVDFDGDSSTPSIADRLLEELLSPDMDMEIGYPQGTRTIFEPAILLPSGLQSGDGRKAPEFAPAADWVVLSVGGARGITTEILNELLLPGMTLILLGRSPEPEAESSDTQALEDVAALRRYFLQTAAAQGEKVTPVQIEQKIQLLQRQREIRQNLQAFRDAGVTVQYHSVDVRNADQFGALLETLYEQFGRIDAVVQGAGIIKDKLIVDKTHDSFDQVFDTKVDSTYILSQHLRPDALKLMVLFASVAGRTGNRGQSDYATANEIINRFGWWMEDHWPHTRVMAINWGPWDVTGMASEEVNRQFRLRGVIPIPPASGRRFFSQELHYGRRGEVELVAGFFEDPSQQSASGAADQSGPMVATASTPQTMELTDYPFLTAQPQIQPNGTLMLQQTISLVSHPYLRHHCLDGKPVLAAACGTELMAEFVQAGWPDWVVCEAKNVRVLKGIAFDPEQSQDVKLQARASTHADATSLEVLGEIVSTDRPLPHYRGTFVLRPQLEPAPPNHFTGLTEGLTLEMPSTYRECTFHGPLFQVVNGIEHLSSPGADCWVTGSDPKAWMTPKGGQLIADRGWNWIFDPGLLDGSLQVGLIWLQKFAGTVGLPQSFTRVTRYGSPIRPGESLRLLYRLTSFNGSKMIFDAAFVDGDNCIRLMMEQIEGSCTKALNRLVGQWVDD